jgi:hypothetical protein
MRWLWLMPFILFAPGTGKAGGLSFDAETGYVFTSLNDVRSPGLGGTFLSLADDLAAAPSPYFRLEALWRAGEKHQVRALWAPLRLTSRGTLPRETRFEDTVFPAGSAVLAYYRFDSYRITYRYRLVQRPSFEWWAGLTAKVRDAEIALYGAGHGVKTNTGPVPLLNLRLAWKPWSGRTGLLLDVDAAAAKQGRAEDVLIALTRELREGVTGRLGYRMLEGGADNDEVYTFAWLHYAVVGLAVDL